MAQVIFRGVPVVEVGVQVRVHQDRGVEEDGEGQVEVESEVEEVKENHTYATWREDDGHVNHLSQEDHDTLSERQEKMTKQRAAVLTRADRASRDCSCHSCWCTWCHG